MPHADGNLLRRRDLPSRLPAIATALVLTLGFGVSMAVSLPGYLSYDSVIQLLEGRTGVYSGWHPPIMSWLLGLADTVTAGTALFVVCNALLLFGSLLSLLRVVPRPSWLAVPCALFCVLTPQFLLYQGIVWKDVLFANAAVASFAALAQVATQEEGEGLRWSYLILAILLLSLTALSRQNGLLLLPFGAIAVAWMAVHGGASKNRAWVLGVGALLGAAILVSAGDAALARRTAKDSGAARQLRVLEAYDLAGGFAADPSLDIAVLRLGDPKLFERLKTDGARLYSPVRSDTLARSASLQQALGSASNNILHRPWRDYVISEPGTYLRQRAEVFYWVFLTPKIGSCVPYVVGLRGPTHVFHELGLQQRLSWRDKIADAYGKRLLGTPLFSHLAFLILALCELAFLLYRRRATDVPWICLLSGAIIFSLSFFVVSIACDYRYLYLLDLSALAALYWIALTAGYGARVDR